MPRRHRPGTGVVVTVARGSFGARSEGEIAESAPTASDSRATGNDARRRRIRMEGMTVSSKDPRPTSRRLSFEQARDKLIRVVAELEQGSPHSRALAHPVGARRGTRRSAARSGCSGPSAGSKRLDQSSGRRARTRARRSRTRDGPEPRGSSPNSAVPRQQQETADRKAEFSRTYRASQNTRNLIAALLVTLAVVVVIVFAVPRGSLPERGAHRRLRGRGRMCPPPRAEQSSTRRFLTNGSPTPRASRATPCGRGPSCTCRTRNQGFLRVAQGFDADPAWATRALMGADSDGTVTHRWGSCGTCYDIPDPSRAGNVSFAMSTRAGQRHRAGVRLCE